MKESRLFDAVPGQNGFIHIIAKENGIHVGTLKMLPAGTQMKNLRFVAAVIEEFDEYVESVRRG